MSKITRRDFIKLGAYGFAGLIIGPKWPIGGMFSTSLDLPGQFENWGQSDLTFGKLVIPFSYLPSFPPHRKFGMENN